MGAAGEIMCENKEYESFSSSLPANCKIKPWRLVDGLSPPFVVFGKINNVYKIFSWPNCCLLVTIVLHKKNECIRV